MPQNLGCLCALSYAFHGYHSPRFAVPDLRNAHRERAKALQSLLEDLCAQLSSGRLSCEPAQQPRSKTVPIAEAQALRNSGKYISAISIDPWVNPCNVQMPQSPGSEATSTMMNDSISGHTSGNGSSYLGSSSSSGSTSLGSLEDAALQGTLYAGYCILTQLLAPGTTQAQLLMRSFRLALEAARSGEVLGYEEAILQAAGQPAISPCNHAKGESAYGLGSSLLQHRSCTLLLVQDVNMVSICRSACSWPHAQLGTL